MVKAVLAEEFLQNYISSVCETSSSCTVGVIAGHISSQRDYVVALLPTPAEDDEEEGDKGPGKGVATTKRRGIGAVNEHWIAEHARQVMRMLPGGLSVMGIYAAGPEDELSNNQSKLRQILFSIYKLFQKKQVSMSVDAETLDWTILQISTKSKKLTCKTFNVTDPKSTAKPADWKFQSFVNSWSCVSCRLQINLRIPFQKRFRDCSHYSKFVLNGTDNLLNAVKESMVLVNGQLRDEKEPIESLLGKKKGGKKSSSGSFQPLDIKAELLMDKAVQDPIQDLETTISGDTKVIGWVQAKAYLSPKSTFGDVEKVIKEDIERSLRVRFELLGEELRQSSGDEEVKEVETDPPSIIATPQRVLAKLPGTPICVSDYVFQDEQPQDITAHFLELLNFTVTEEDVDFNCEQMPDDSLLQQIETASSHSSEAANLDELLHKPGGGELMRYAGFAFAGVGAALAMGMSYLALSQE